MFKLPIQADDLIPHQSPMKMVDKIISYNDDTESAELEYTVPDDSPFVNDNGILDPECYLEIIAQAAAAQHGFNLKRENSPEEQGFLVGVRNLLVNGQIRAGETLTIKVAKGTEIESISSISGSIYCEGREIASASITVWHGNPS